MTVSLAQRRSQMGSSVTFSGKECALAETVPGLWDMTGFCIRIGVESLEPRRRNESRQSEPVNCATVL